MDWTRINSGCPDKWAGPPTREAVAAEVAQAAVAGIRPGTLQAMRLWQDAYYYALAALSPAKPAISLLVE